MGDIALLVVLPFGHIDKEYIDAYISEIVNYLGIFRPDYILAEKQVISELSLRTQEYAKEYHRIRTILIEQADHVYSLKQTDTTNQPVKYPCMHLAYDLNDRTITIELILRMIKCISTYLEIPVKEIVFWGYEYLENTTRRLCKDKFQTDISYNRFTGNLLPQNNIIIRLFYQ